MESKDPLRILRSTAERLESQYERPPKRPSEDLVKTEGEDMVVYVSDVRPKRAAGNNMHHGRWVLIRYNQRRGSIEVSYKKDGVAGNSDKRTSLSLDEATPDKLEQITHDYLRGPSARL